eukprot:TRINITY_DN19794_c0_g1_i1.p1 TRINITY_DN19794_c0_g1~~TRINITY_DN19794_c0_g1_i1.p1  ORF type:complete len:334 (+),score=66.53 TRINITY_DN19794_c0_g1_i1:1338-2339(+)
MSLPGEVAVVGPLADVPLFGNYEGVNLRGNQTTILQGLRAVSPLLAYHYGVNVSAPASNAALTAAVEAAANAEVTIAVVGISQDQEHEGGTRPDLGLPGWQPQLLDECRNAAATLVVVLVGGSAIAAEWAQRRADAVVWAGYGGEEAGGAVADVLFGKASPSGKLPMTWYRSLAQLPPFPSMDMRAPPGRTYRFLSEAPLWPFGFGLSYSNLTVQLAASPPQEVAACAPLSLSVKVHNVGSAAAAEVLQLYLTRGEGTWLAAFSRTSELAPGADQVVQLTARPEALCRPRAPRPQWPSASTVGFFVSLRGPLEPLLRGSVSLGPSGAAARFCP